MADESGDSRMPAALRRLWAPWSGRLRALWDTSFVRLVRDAAAHFAEEHGPEAAAGLAYYALFSLFPLLLILVVISSFLLEQQKVYDQVVKFVTQLVPVSSSLVEANVQQLLDNRGAIGVVGVVGALWSASGFFTTLARNINRAWPNARPRGFLRQRLAALRMLVFVFALLLLFLFSTTFVDVLLQIRLPFLGGRALFGDADVRFLSVVISLAATFVVFVALYRLVPTVKVPWSAVLWSALIASVAWELAKRGFAIYLSSGVVNYDVVYGSLSTVVALMLYVYISSLIILFGAHMGAVLSHHAGALQQAPG